MVQVQLASGLGVRLRRASRGQKAVCNLEICLEKSNYLVIYLAWPNQSSPESALDSADISPEESPSVCEIQPQWRDPSSIEPRSIEILVIFIFLYFKTSCTFIMIRLVGWCLTTVPVTKTIRLSEWVTPRDTAIPGMTSLKDGDLQHSSALAQSPKEI